jgi:selenocysteine-specific elongation factor
VPSGRAARIRGLQTHRTKIEEAVPGSRVAVNLTGVGKHEIETGEVVTVPGWLNPTVLVDVQLRYLSDAPQPLKHNAEVDFFCGAAEVPARVRLLGTEALAPGGAGWAQLRLSRPVALVRGDRFILRWLSPSITVGGGVVVDPAPRRRHRRFRPEVIERLETLAHGTPEEIVLEALERQQPCEARELFGRLTLSAESAAAALDAMLAEKRVLVIDDLENTISNRIRSRTCPGPKPAPSSSSRPWAGERSRSGYRPSWGRITASIPCGTACRGRSCVAGCKSASPVWAGGCSTR